MGWDKAKFDKAGATLGIVLAIVYGLLLLFFLYITVIVVRKEAKTDKTILAMLICLQLCCLS